jgi:hypothetical protein
MDLEKNEALVGHSIAGCIQEIIEGRVDLDNVDYITTSIKFETPKQLDMIIERYRKLIWHLDPDEGERICRLLVEQNRIEQPRVYTQDLWTKRKKPLKSTVPSPMCKHRFYVTGKEVFPLSLLKIDECYPENNTDVYSIEDNIELGWQLPEDQVTISVCLSHVGDSTWTPSKDEWSKKGWTVRDHNYNPLKSIKF